MSRLDGDSFTVDESPTTVGTPVAAVQESPLVDGDSSTVSAPDATYCEYSIH